MKHLLVALAVIFFSSQALADTSIRLMTEEFAPYQYYEGAGDNKKITGVSIEVVRALQKKIGNSDKIKVLPWSRALKLLRLKPNAALFSTVRTPEREPKFKWVGPIAVAEVVFFRKKGGSVHFTSIEEAKSVGKIGVTKNIATHEILSGKGFKNLDVMQSGADAKNLKRLIAGRIDVWPTEHFAGVYSAKEQGILDQIEVVPNVSILLGHLYIAFNKETDDSIIHEWQTALDHLRTSGMIDKIVEKYDR